MSGDPIPRALELHVNFRPTSKIGAEVRDTLFEVVQYTLGLRDRYAGALAQLREAQTVIGGVESLCESCRDSEHAVCRNPLSFTPEAGGKFSPTVCCCGLPV